MNVPRNHHYVPQFYLKGFTKRSCVDDALWVCDVLKRRAWQSTPLKSARERDFYRGDLGPTVDPMWLERVLGNDVEPFMAQVLEFILDTKAIPPCGLAYEVFLNFVATSLVRGPSMRTATSTVFHARIQQMVTKLAAVDQGQSRFREALGIHGNTLEEMLRLNEQGAFNYDFDRITHLKAMIAQVGIALEAFARRTWTIRALDDGLPDFVCSDVPVGIIPLAKKVPLVWFDPNALIVMPLDRRTVTLGSVNELALPGELEIRHIAHINATTACGASQVYCSGSEFVVLSRGKVQRVELVVPVPGTA